ncbi:MULTISPECIES: hypothetical protein [Brucella/Ochrobactrum group]|uniref:hypothetical protein n=1 Tax=Brucella/Ochrobactrum group TaxID=2826938 RepID=UPI0016567E6C|nr:MULTISPECIES: hypothetical protein [Brucella/Ochrobactrum group]MBC8717487.1 hypothetical protein [Ochrobactrum sp. Marseille-Q0166]
MHRLAITLVTLTFCITASISEAALAPNYQRAKELSAVIEAAAQSMPQHPIDKIIYQKDDQYQVIAGPCTIRATIVSKPMKNGMVGPRQFDVKLGKARCR